MFTPGLLHYRLTINDSLMYILYSRIEYGREMAGITEQYNQTLSMSYMYVFFMGIVGSVYAYLEIRPFFYPPESTDCGYSICPQLQGSWKGILPLVRSCVSALRFLMHSITSEPCILGF